MVKWASGRLQKKAGGWGSGLVGRSAGAYVHGFFGGRGGLHGFLGEQVVNEWVEFKNANQTGTPQQVGPRDSFPIPETFFA